MHLNAGRKLCRHNTENLNAGLKPRRHESPE